jgi:hypothetical protein
MPEEPIVETPETTPPVEATPAKPEWLEAKFWTGEVMESFAKQNASYKEIQAKQSSVGLEIPDAMALPDDANLDQVLAAAKLDKREVAEYALANNGKLSDEHVKALSKILPGVPRRLLEETAAQQLVAGLQGVNKAVFEANELAGGEPALKNLLQWASSLPEQRRNELNEKLKDPRTMVDAVKTLLFDHKQALGAGKAEPLLEGDGGTGGGGPVPYASKAEFRVGAEKAKTDFAARKEHEARSLATGPAHLLPAI